MKTLVKVALGIIVLVVIVGALAGGSDTPTADKANTPAATPASEKKNAGEATPAPAVAPRPRSRTIDTASATGDFAIAQATGDINDPAEIRLRVRSSIPQQASVTWTMTCTQADGAGSSDDQFDAATPVNRRLRMPSRDVSDCTVSANAQLGEGGKVTVTLTGKKRP